MTKVIVPGSFDPITLGHQNIIEQACYLFDEVIIAILNNHNKHSSFFKVEERIEIVKQLYEKINKIRVVTFDGALVDLAILNECKIIIRGLRGLSDLDYEIQLAQVNNDLSNNKVRTMCLFPDIQYQYLSSSMVKGVNALDKSVEKYVDPIVYKKILTKRRNINE